VKANSKMHYICKKEPLLEGPEEQTRESPLGKQNEINAKKFCSNNFTIFIIGG